MDHSPEFLRLVDDAKTRVREIAVGEVMEKFAHSANIVVIDTREEHEWNEGHIAGSIYLGKGVIERDIVKTVPEKKKEIILYCGGGFRSAIAGDNLQRMGYNNVFSLAGGWKSWIAANGPTEISTLTFVPPAAK